MILPHCGHTFCSRCIRSYLDSKGPVLGDCPSCREKVRPDELVRNVKLREVILQYRQLEAALVAQAQLTDDTGISAEDNATLSAATTRSGTAKRSRDSLTHEDADSDFEREAPATRKRTRASGSSRAAEGEGRRSSRLSARSDAVASRTTPASGATADVVDLSQDAGADGALAATHERESSGDSRVECPICSMSISERNINSHMDTCLSKTTTATSKSSSPVDRHAERPESTGSTGGVTMSAAAVPAATAARMPKMTYHVLKDPQLRKLCKDLGLSTRGDRSQLEWRHRQYAQEHNTACDAEEAPNPKQIVLEIERRERNMAAPTQSRPSIFSRQTSRQREVATDPSAGSATAAGDSTGETNRDTSQDAAFEDLIQQIEARLGRKRKRVYTYVYESAEEDGEDQALPAQPANAEHAFRMEYGEGPGAYGVDLRVEVDGIRLTTLLLEEEGLSEKITFPGLSWEITDDGLTLMYRGVHKELQNEEFTASSGGTSAGERRLRCQKEVAMDVERAIIAAMQAGRRRHQQEQQPAALGTLVNGRAADIVPERTDSAESLAVSPPAAALTDVHSAAGDSSVASAMASTRAAEVRDAEADAKVCRVCYCGEGELDCPVSNAASAKSDGPADLLQPCRCNSWIHRKCLQDWISSRSASTDERRRCEVCEEPIGAADREGALQAAPPPSAAQLKAVGIKKFSALCGFPTCSLAGTGAHYHCVLGHEMAGRKCVYSSKDAKQAERHGVAMTRLGEKRRRASAPSMVGAQAWSRVAA